jgi:S-formylglutathione hydrolase FrmB
MKIDRRRRIRPGALLALLLLAGLAPRGASGQLFDHKNLDHLNRKLAGRVVDYTHNHGSDRRIQSAVLGLPRDLYVYLPPGYTPAKSYPLVLYMHMGYLDEHAFIGLPIIKQVDALIARGEFPPAIIACPDGMIDGTNNRNSRHSFYLNGIMGAFEDHILTEVVPLLTANYSIRPERQAHALVGSSAGGLGALSIALRHRDYFGSVAGVAAPANLRYDTPDGNRQNFDPATFRWKETYDPDQVMGVFRFGLRKTRARRYIEPVFGSGPDVSARIQAINPADLLLSTNLQPGELPIYLNYPGRDNWNFDAQAESFAWLASQRGVAVTLERVPLAQHGLFYFATQHRPAFEWLASHLLPPL